MLLSLFYFKFHHQSWKHRQSPSAFRNHHCQRLSATPQCHCQNTCPSNSIPLMLQDRLQRGNQVHVHTCAKAGREEGAGFRCLLCH